MKYAVFAWLMLFNNMSLLFAKELHAKDLRRFIDLIQRRQLNSDSEVEILDVPESVEDLPEARPMQPGHTLIKPSRGMLKSSVKFPQKDAGHMAVYGNLNNLGITFDKTNQRLLYTNFRKTESILTYLLEKAIRNIQKKTHLNQQKRKPVIVIEIDPVNIRQKAHEYPIKEDSKKLLDIENNASESLDESNEAILSLPTRRKKYKPVTGSKYRDRDASTEADTSASASSGSSDYERNPGNPYSVYKDKYRQNWMWNHFMDGNHMNVNPYAPQFDSRGPSGAALFFGRKWWYYNQGMFGCEGVSWRRQLEHIAKTSPENEGIFNPSPSRRFYQFDPREMSNIIGVPSRASHLPEAEPIQPGHTLLRPALGMLKSALKFPHRELEDGAGVYGNIDNLGLKYDSRNERLMYSGFRRSPADYIMVIPSSSPDKYEKPRFKLESAVLNLDRQAKAKNEILKILKKLNRPALKGVKVFMATENGNNFENVGISLGKESSYYLNEDTPKHVSESESKEILRKDHNALEKNVVTDNSSELELTPTNRNSADQKHKISEDLAKEKSKKKQMWQHSMGTYDHINIIQEAPEIDELVPTNDETIDETNSDIRKWWFYSADDYQPFSRERHR